MTVSPFIMTREQYEGRCRDQLKQAYSGDSASAEADFHRLYPKSTEGAAQELRERGLAAYAENMSHYAHNLGIALRMIGRNIVWYREDIDAIAEYLEHINRWTHGAKWRRARAMTVEDELQIETILAERKAASQ